MSYPGASTHYPGSVGALTRGSAPTLTAWTIWSGFAGQTDSSVRHAVTAEDGGSETDDSSAMDAAIGTR